MRTTVTNTGDSSEEEEAEENNKPDDESSEPVCITVQASNVVKSPHEIFE